MIEYDIINKIPKEDRACYALAKIAAENCGDREIVTWIRSARFERVLKTYFNRNVSFGISQRREACDGKLVKFFDNLSPSKHYLVSLDRAYDEAINNQLILMGFSDITDSVFLRHKPVVIDNFVCPSEGYLDLYGNSIVCSAGTKIKRIILRGSGSIIKIGSNVVNTNNITFDIASNAFIEIKNKCKINAPVKFEVLGHSGSAVISIGERCRFTDALFRLYVSPFETAVVINDDCTFETHFEAHANTGKRIILGHDCMISHNVYMLSGDGHAIFDVNTGDNLNSDYTKLTVHKNNIVFGNHVWCGYGAFIMNGTNVGTGSIIGAKCVLKGTYPNNCSIAGNPAKIVRKDCAWARDMGAQSINTISKEYVSKTSEAKPPVSGQNVLVIGGTGFSGIRLVKRLIDLGNRVTIATRGLKKDSYGNSVNRVTLDVTDFESVKHALQGKRYDVVFDDLAYNPLNVYNILSNVKTSKYIQLSSVMAYGKFHKGLEESEIDLGFENIQLSDWTIEKRKQMNAKDLYVYGKRYAEAIAYKLSDIPVVTVRIPYVFDTRPKYYCEHILNEIPLNIVDENKEIIFVRDIDVGNFLPWIAAQDYSGPINFADAGSITIKELIRYIEDKLKKRAIVSGGNDKEPFNEFEEKSYTFNLDKVKQLGYNLLDLKEWFWKSIDAYINLALNDSRQKIQSDKSDSIVQTSTVTYSFSNKKNWQNHDKTMLALDASKCTGCAACMNVCPKDAIKMTTDSRGFIVPQIDAAKCISCGMCKRTCPKLNLDFPYGSQEKCYAFMADDETRKVSASGGAFLTCAEYIISKGGVVCGAAWTEDFGLEHIIIESKGDLKKLYGSKYLQSSINNVFRTIKKYLKDNRLVLFIGTPCQVDGLRHYLSKDFENLYTIDLLCRGVPSADLFKRYLRESYGTEKLVSISQKNKKRLGWGAYTRIEHSSGAIEHFNMENNIWMKAFLSDFMFRDSCYVCPYPQRKRVGDLSLGDFWQIAKFNKAYDDRLGTSIVIPNTEKGRALIESVNHKLLEIVPVEFELPYNSALNRARKIPANRGVFFDMLSRAPIGAALDRALYGKKYDIGIVGWWSNLNYGGTLTYFALYTTIKSLGYSVMMIRRPHSDATMINENTIPMRFSKKHYVISRLYAHRDMYLLNYACKGFVSGSDQLWNPWLETWAGKDCFLAFANQNSLRISYASSYGNVSTFPEEFVNKYKPELKKFDAISVREDYAVELSKKYFDVDATFVCDPVFLCDRSVYEGLAEQSKLDLPGKYVLNFILDPSDEKSKAIKYIAKNKDFEFVCFTDLQDVQKKIKQFKLPDVYADREIEDLVKAYSKCDFVLTDSFHGTCFAIIFNKPFISIANHNRGEKRFQSLLRWTGLLDRMVNSVEEIYGKPELFQPIDYDKVNARVAAFRAKSLEWLKSALKKMKY